MPENGTLERCEYRLLVPENLSGDPAATEPQDRRDGPKATMGTCEPDKRVTQTEDQNGQCTLLACVQPEVADWREDPPTAARA